MHEIDKNQFGTFLQSLRKEHELTQAQLAQRLYVSDKAVSKWERGLSLPDVTLLIPLAEALEVTVTELLEARRLEPAVPIAPARVEALVQRALTLTERQGQRIAADLPRNALLFGLSLLLALGEIALLFLLGHTWQEMANTVLLVSGMCAIFGAYFWLLTKERLPAFYDENPLNIYMDGPVRLNVPGVRINNDTWPRILRALRISLTAMMAGYPLLYLLLTSLFPAMPLALWQALTLTLLLCGIFLPVYLAGRSRNRD